MATGGVEVPLSELEVASTARATTVEARQGGLRIGTVEHALAALAGLGVYEGLVLDVDGPEMPLLDGGAAAWCAAIGGLQVPRGRPRLRVAREATFDVGPSRYDFAPGDGAIDLGVHVDLGDARFAPEATWRGDPDDFVARIAPARTFTLAHDVEELLRRGLARHVDPASVVVIAPDAVHSAGRAFSPDEPARHKLLDLIGDLYLHGGPPLGRVRVTRPGHASNARALRRAIDEGVLAT
jgi:UDP-3-O-[3-hydroxymyristoyl] N-acetylglucosamine deacetylase